MEVAFLLFEKLWFVRVACGRPRCGSVERAVSEVVEWD